MNTPQTLSEAVAYVRELTRDDPATFKRGYTIPNAVAAVAEVFGFDRDALAAEVGRQAWPGPVWKS